MRTPVMPFAAQKSARHRQLPAPPGSAKAVVGRSLELFPAIFASSSSRISASPLAARASLSSGISRGWHAGPAAAAGGKQRAARRCISCYRSAGTTVSRSCGPSPLVYQPPVHNCSQNNRPMSPAKQTAHSPTAISRARRRNARSGKVRRASVGLQAAHGSTPFAGSRRRPTARMTNRPTPAYNNRNGGPGLQNCCPQRDAAAAAAHGPALSGAGAHW